MSDQVVTSPSLLLRIRDSSDHEAWTKFQEVYLPIIRSFCLHWGLQSADADDIAQEVLAVVARSMPSFDYHPGRGRFRAWLGTVTSNEIKTFLARERTRKSHGPSASVDLQMLPDSISEWTVIFTENIFQTACERVRAQCDPLTWHSFQATWMDRRAASEVAREAGIPVHSVYVNKSRVLQRLEREVRMLADDLPLDFLSSNEDSGSP